MAVKVKIYGNITPYRWQVEAHNIITDWLSTKEKTARTLVIKAARQRFGKSAFVKAELLRFALTYPGTINSYVSPDLNLARKMFKEIKKVKELITSSNGQVLELGFVNGSTIKFHSEAQGEGLRGYTTTGVLIIDEGSSFKDSTFYEFIRPWTTVHKPLTIIVSTPKAETGFFWDSYNMGYSDNPYYHTIDWVQIYSDECPISAEDLAIRDSMPPMKWITEYEGRFATTTSPTFGDYSKCLISIPDKKSKELYIGLDFGGGNGGDYTVLTAFDENKNMQFTWGTNQMSPSEQVEVIYKILEDHKNIVKVVQAESNSIGQVYIDMLRQKGCPIKKFITTNQSKRRLVEQMQVAIHKGEVGILNEPQIITQMSAFECNVSPNGTFTYSGTKGIHDDYVMSMLIAYDSVVSNRKFSVKLV